MFFKTWFHIFSRCESCHGQAERLLDSAKEMEDSIAVNLRLVHLPVYNDSTVIICFALRRKLVQLTALGS